MRPRVLKYNFSGGGEPLVLLPGGLTGWLSWMPHQERLSTGWRVIRVQPIHNELGTAGLPGEPGYTRDTERESLLLTLDELGIEQAHFAGWSGGAKALIDFTIAHDERVSSLTLVEPAAYWMLQRLGEADDELENFIDFVNGLSGKSVTADDLAVFLWKAGFVGDVGQARTDPYWERALPHRMTLSWLSEGLMSSDASIDDLGGIDCQVLLTKGTTTEPWERRLVDLLGDYLPNSQVVEIEGGHAHHIERIDEFLNVFEGHLSRVTAI